MSAGGYAEAYDPRVSGRVSLQHLRQSNAASLPSDLLFAVLLSKSLVALALHVANDWLVAQGYSPWTIAALVQGAGGVVLALWERPWEVSRGGKRRTEPSSPLYPVLFALETLFALLSISHLSVLRFILLTSFAPLWARGLPFVKASSRKIVERGNAFSLTTAMVVIAYLADSTLSTGSNRTGYIYLLLHLLACGQRSEMFAGFDGDEQQKGRMHANGAVAAAFVAGVIAFLRLQFGPTASTLTSSSSSPLAGPETSSALALLGIGLLGVTFICVDPLLTRSLLTHFPPPKLLTTGWPISAFATAFVGYVGFDRGIGWGEAAVAVIGWKAISHIASTDPRAVMASAAGGVSTGSSAPNQSFPARFATFYRHFRATIKTILASPESRRIYFFLCLNLGFMFIQMAYGIWTNSLGLISDSIHMFFDCLALAMGLFASVMATWPSNDSFTYGYTRVETLSGFANGIFLCLISIFIVFEAIERLIDPPEMNTGQLLTVSAVGLAVNLVGMVATGHAHGGHSHGGGGGHSHGHSHAPVKSKVTPFLTEKEEEEEDHNGHSHNGHSSHNSHSHSTPTRSQPHSHSHSLSSPAPLASPTHARSPSHAHAHSHAPSDHSHSHAHNGHNGCDHDDEHEDDEHAAAHGGHSHNMKGVFLHVMADTLGSVGVIISTLLINRYGWTGFDPLASIFIAVLIFASVVPLVVDSGKLLMLDMGEEQEADVRKALTALHRVEGVASFTRARFWPKDPSSMVGSICVQLAPSPGSTHGSAYDSHGRPTHQHYADCERVRARVRKTLRANIAGLDELTVQVEPTSGLG
ncbi:cation diffusion facilitator family transporter [Rhodotorula paludigena]|uniref:cation diffusion facilitator family transporter n=1 Tax=Rhodotorula paludigena TaxID=86838 RepID=UPI00317D3715